MLLALWSHVSRRVRTVLVSERKPARPARLLVVEQLEERASSPAETSWRTSEGW